MNDKTLAPSLAPLSSSINQSSPSSSGHGSSPPASLPLVLLVLQAVAPFLPPSTLSPLAPSFLPFFHPTNAFRSSWSSFLPSFCASIQLAHCPSKPSPASINPPCGLSLVLTISTHQPPPPPRFAQRPSLNAVRLPHPTLSPAPSSLSPLCTKLHTPPPSGSVAQRAAMRSSALDFNVGGTGSTWAFLPNKMFDRRNALVLSLSPFLIGRMFLREPSWKYSAKLVGS